mmetsp:Transcript_22868/g.32770  ORF Transcript_22868/g.32770 Transcript_22868/m.32770 type:complete len:89 (-) Transcript_22868:34-300(-)
MCSAANNSSTSNMPRRSERHYVLDRLQKLVVARMTFAAFQRLFDSPSQVDDEDDELAMVMYGYGKSKRYFNRGEYSKRGMKDWRSFSA